MRLWPMLVLAAVTACGGDSGCPLVGCVSELVVQLPAGSASARACVAGVCSTEVVDGSVRVPLSRLGDATDVEVVVDLVDAAGTATTVRGDAAVRSTRPAGRSCPPTCLNGEVRVDPGGAMADVGPAA